MKNKMLPLVLCLLLLIPAPVVCGAVLACDSNYSHFTVEDKVTVEPTPVKFGVVNFLCIGTDESGALTDVLMLMSFNSENKTISVLSIPRDTKITYGGNIHKINSAYAYGKEELLIQKVTELTGASVNYFAKVNLSGFEAVIDALGGVDFHVPADLKYSDPAQGLKINLKEGMQHLDGQHALQLIRYRRYPEGDIQRVRVQQDFVRELLRQKLTPALINQAPDLFKEISRHVKTNFTVSDFIEYKAILTPLLNGEVKTYTLPGSAKYIDRISYFIPDTKQARALIDEHFSKG